MNQNQNPQIENNNDLTCCPSFNCYTSSNTSSSSSAAAAAAAIKISNSLPNKDDLYHDNEFNFVIDDNNNTVYPLFNQSENSCDTLQNLFITEREDDTSSSDEEDEENENVNEPVFCVWRGTKSDTSSSVALTKCKKSSSTGSRSGSKRWRIRDLLRRSNSEGKDQPINMLLTQHHNNKKVVEAVTKQKRNSVEGSVNNGRLKQPSSPSVHEIFYVQNRAKTEDGKRRSYLPYRQGLVGFFSNVNGKGKSFPF